MRVLVCGATGCVGRAVVHALRSRGHQVVQGARSAVDGRHAMHIDFSQPVAPAAWAKRLGEARIEVVVNCVGILMPSAGQRFERVHAQGPIELFRGAAFAGVRRVVQVSALGVGHEPAALASPYLHSKLLADDALAALPIEWAVLRPSLVYGPGSQSAAMFATLASLPVIALPGLGRQAVQPIHVYELAEAIVRVIEQTEPVREVFELGGAEVLGYREMLAAYRAALGLTAPLWLPVPMPAMRLAAWLAEGLPQRAFCRDTIALLERGSVPRVNALPSLLGRTPSTLAHGLAITAPAPAIDLRVQISPPIDAALRLVLALMWFRAGLVALLWPQQSALPALLAQAGLGVDAAGVAMWFCGGISIGLSALVLRRRAPWIDALQFAVLIGGAALAALHTPQPVLAIVAALPAIALVGLRWLATQASGDPDTAALPIGSERPRRAALPARGGRSAWLSL